MAQEYTTRYKLDRKMIREENYKESNNIYDKEEKKLA